MPSINEFNDLLFSRGYLITDENFSFNKEGWKEYHIDELVVYYDDRNDIHYFKKDGNWVFVLGVLIDTSNNTLDKEIICRAIIEKMGSSSNDFYDYVDGLSGRFILMYHDGQRTKLMSDATGMKSIVYSMKHLVIASHVELVRQLTNAKESKTIKKEWIKQYKGYYIPGHFTPYENIYFLTPNTEFELQTKSVQRFFPREDLGTLEVDFIESKVSNLVKEQMKLVVEQDKKLIFSLTAGSDSRSTLALLKEFIDEIDFFTYYKISKKLPEGVKSLEIDRKVVEEMAYNLNLTHSFLPLNEDDTTEEFKEFVGLMKRNTIRPHGYRLAKFYYDSLPKESLHIRSNILEIARYFYRENLDLPRKADAVSLAKCYSKKSVDDPDIINLFSQYMEQVDMNNIYNYDPFDILYWEYRMGIWHSQLLLESDIAHETFIPFNCRNILKLLLSVSDQNKKKNTVFNNIVEKNWPVLNYWGINTLEKPIDRLDEQIDDYGYPLKNIKFTSSNGVKVKSYNYGRKMKFHIDKSGPEKDEYASATLTMNTIIEDSYHCIIHLRSPYENQKHNGRMVYQLFLEDQLILEEDISNWKETNQIQIKFKALKKKTDITIKVKAVKDCESWNWGRAGTILIERLVLRKSENGTNEVSVTSPYSIIYE